MATKSKAKPKSSTEDILATARDRWDLAVEAEAKIRADALEDLKFRAGDQWPEAIKQARSLDNRPWLTINKIPQFLRQVTNDQRQNRPSIKVSPVDDKADIETAKIYQGMIRHIEVNSNADVAYDTAFAGAATHGFGYFRVVTDYCDAYSFEQDIFIKRVRNPFTVYLDPNYQEPDASDANWGFIFEEMSEEDYRAQYGDSKLGSMRDWESIGDTAAGWVGDKTVRVAEYFFKTFKSVTLVQLSDGSIFEESELNNLQLSPEITIVSTRKSTLPAIKWLKINGIEILEETDWPGKWIPIIPVLGDELDIDGEKVLEGIVRHAKDPQRMYNFWASAETETIALAPRAPFIGRKGQFEGFEAQWATANTRNHAYLEYNDKGGAPPPMRNVYEAPTQAITQARMQSSDDLKSTTGIYDASLGARSNENSGVAIQRRNVQAQTNNFHYIDNLSRAIRHLGRILVDLIPHVYDTARAVRTLSEDGEQEIVRINEIFQDKGAAKSYMLGHGKYDVSVSSGPSFQTKRQEAAAAMLDLSKTAPVMMNVAPDLMVKYLDVPGADQLSARLKKTVPKELLDDKDKEQEQQPIPPEAQQQMQAMGQMIEQLTAQLNESSESLKTKKLELESKERIEMKKLEVAVELKMAELGSKEGLAVLQHEIAQIGQRLELLHMNQEIENENGAQGGNAAAPQDQQSTGAIQSPGSPMEIP